MPNQQSRKELEEIIKRYLAGSASPEEMRFVESYFAYIENKTPRENFNSEDLDGIKFRLRERIQNGIQQKEPAPVVVLHPNRRGWLRIAAAAILIGISFGTYFLIKNQKATQPAVSVVPANPDIAPGGNRAILTLTNGSQIVLDSARNGVLAKQGNVNVTKTDSGKLAYNASSEKPGETGTNTLTTPRGGQYQLVLPDGTRVWLNAASSITYPTAFTGRERTVEVTGEAYFEVVHNAKMPFRVKTNDQMIEDIGTAFNVNAYPDEKSLNTTLVEGMVKVIVDGKRDKDAAILKPGQQAQVRDAQIKMVQNANLEQVLAWKNGKMSLANITVEQIMQDISRWYDVDIKYSGAVPDQKFYGLIDRNVPLSTVLLALKNYGVATKIEGKTIIVQ